MNKKRYYIILVSILIVVSREDTRIDRSHALQISTSSFNLFHGSFFTHNVVVNGEPARY